MYFPQYFVMYVKKVLWILCSKSFELSDSIFIRFQCVVSFWKDGMELEEMNYRVLLPIHDFRENLTKPERYLGWCHL